MLAWLLLQPPSPELTVRTAEMMSTAVLVSLRGDDAEGSGAAIAFAAIKEVERVCNRFDPQSELSRLNATAAEHPVECSEMLWEVLLLSREAHRLSGGSFDISATPLMTLWGFYRRRAELPGAEQVAAALELVGLDKVVFNDEARSVYFTLPGMSFDLGGIAKGYAVDRAVEALAAAGFTEGVVSLGGNLRTLGEPPLGEAGYSVSIRDPLDTTKTFGRMLLLNEAVATSGGYERFVEIGGRRYGHIMNPATGRPAEGVLSATVIAPTAALADALSTAIFVGGAELAEQLHATCPELRIVIMTPKPSGFEVRLLPENMEVGGVK